LIHPVLKELPAAELNATGSVKKPLLGLGDPAPRIVSTTRGDQSMKTVTTKDGTQIFYKDWWSGQPIVFSHGWPLSSDDWDAQMMFFLNHGFRVIAHDRRGHGRSKGWSRLLRQISLQDKWICLEVDSDRLFIFVLRQWS
jgi:hypothetical protein